MTWEIFLGIVALVGFLVTIGKIFAPLIQSITSLQDSIKNLDETIKKQGKDIDGIQDELHDHDKRITILEAK